VANALAYHYKRKFFMAKVTGGKVSMKKAKDIYRFFVEMKSKN
jgi:hypothetical protein